MDGIWRLSRGARVGSDLAMTFWVLVRLVMAKDITARLVHRFGGPEGQARLFANVNPFIERAHNPKYSSSADNWGSLSSSKATRFPAQQSIRDCPWRELNL
jgi:hypothetical protein